VVGLIDLEDEENTTLRSIGKTQEHRTVSQMTQIFIVRLINDVINNSDQKEV
jgi:hypothetical protein